MLQFSHFFLLSKRSGHQNDSTFLSISEPSDQTPVIQSQYKHQIKSCPTKFSNLNRLTRTHSLCLYFGKRISQTSQGYTRISATRTKRNTGTANAVIQTAMKFRHVPTRAFKNLTMRGPLRALGCARPWSVVQIITASTCAITEAASPIQPPKTGPRMRGNPVKKPTTRSSPGATQSHWERVLPAFPSLGIKCNKPATSNKEPRVIPPIQIK